MYLENCGVKYIINSFVLLNSSLCSMPHPTKAREVNYVKKQQETFLYSFMII